MLTVYENIKRGGQRRYLVANNDKERLIRALTRAQFCRNWLQNIAEKPYTGKKYTDCVWIIEG